MAWTGDDESFQGFIDKHGLSFPTLSDDVGDVYARFQVPAQPALVVVSTEGDVQLLFGAVDPALLDNILTDVTA